MLIINKKHDKYFARRVFCTDIGPLKPSPEWLCILVFNSWPYLKCQVFKCPIYCLPYLSVIFFLITYEWLRYATYLWTAYGICTSTLCLFTNAKQPKTDWNFLIIKQVTNLQYCFQYYIRNLSSSIICRR